MSRSAKYRQSWPLLVAIVAVVMVAAGTATAANLITSAQIKDNTIRSRDVRDHSLLARDFKPGQLPAGPRGSTGPPGATGPRGATGAAGRDGFGLLAYPSESDLLANGSSANLTAACPAGTFVTGGDAGAFDDVTGDEVGNQVVQNVSLAGTGGYSAHFANKLASGHPAQIFIDAVCANANQVITKRVKR